jgi:hypothetical protein
MGKTLSQGVKWPGSETNHSPSSSAEVKNAWSYTPLPNTSSRHGYLVKHGTILPLPYLDAIYCTYNFIAAKLIALQAEDWVE